MTHAAGNDQSWDERAAWYDQIADHFEPEYRKATHALLNAVGAGPGIRILDLACGPGHTTAAANARGARALGIDTSPVMIEAARRRFPTADFEVADMLDPPSGPWNAIVSRMGAHHADPAWAHAAWRALQPGGRLAIAELGDDDAHAHANGMRNLEYWVDLFRTAGFVRITTTTRDLRLGDLAVSLSTPEADHFRPYFRNRPVHVIAGRKPRSNTRHEPASSANSDAT